MRRNLPIFVVTLLVTIFAGLNLAGAQTYRLKAVAASRPTPQFGLWTWFSEELQKRTKGQATLDVVSWPEAGFSGFEMLRVSRQGLMDFIDVLPSSSSGDLPVMEAVDLPGLYPDYETSVKAHRNFIPALKRYEQELGGIVLGIYLWPYGVVFSRKPVSDPAALNNLKIRASGTSEVEFFKALGAEPVSLPFAEVYTALERGTVDAAVTGTYSGFALKWYEVTKYMVDLNKGSNCGILVVSKRTWEKLPAEIKKIVLKLGEEFTEKGIEIGRQSTKEGIENNKEKGMEFLPPGRAMQKSIKEAVMKTVVPSWAHRAGKDAKPIFNQYIAPFAGFSLE